MTVFLLLLVSSCITFLAAHFLFTFMSTAGWSHKGNQALHMGTALYYCLTIGLKMLTFY
jgi:hypothetical protein